MESQDFWCQKENMENKDFYGKDSSVSNPCLASIDCADLSDSEILTQRNRNCAGSRERISPNSGINFGPFFYEDHSKHQRSEADLTGLECRCDLSSCKSNFSLNHSKSRNSQVVESGLKRNTVTSEERFGPVNNSKLEAGGRSLSHVTSGGNLNELEFVSSFAKRLVSPKARTPLTPKMVPDLDLSRTKRCRCVCEFGWDGEEAQTYQSPNYSLHCSPYENPSSNESKPSSTPRMDSLSQRHQRICSKPKSHNLKEELIRQSLSNEPVRKVNFGKKKGKSGLSIICKVSIVWMLLVVVFLTVTMKKSSLFRPNFEAEEFFYGINQTNFFLNPVDLRTNHSEDVNLERQIEPYIDEGELEENIKLLASNETIFIEKGVETLDEPNFTEMPTEENSSTEEPQLKSEDGFKSETTKQCGTLDFTGDGFEEEPVTIPVKKIGYASTEERQSKFEDKFESENTKQRGMFEFTGDGFEGPITIPLKKIGYSALVKADTGDRVEVRKVEMRIRFCMAFVSVVVCVSLVSCIFRRKQFGEMLERYSSSNKGENSSKKRARKDSRGLLEGSYGSIVTYEKIPTKKVRL
jgi:hypothetical protein